MVPTLDEGDRLLCRSIWRARVGDLVVVSAPDEPTRALVKRVVALRGGRLEVRGDNEAVSVDSRHFGALEPKALLGVAFYRYAPAGAVGRLPRPRR
jgi:nickel-type superoxide dismutase maturation protease